MSVVGLPVSPPARGEVRGANRFLSLLLRAGAPAVIAHRGDSAHAPENTLEAARLGREAGADAWELDVRLSRDGVPVVIHDASLARTTDVCGRFAGDPRGATGFLVSDFDFEEIRALDAGSWFLGAGGGHRTASAFGSSGRIPADARERYLSGEVRVPSLDEALRLTERLDWLVNVEIKSTGGADLRALDAVAGSLARTGAGPRALISSFDHTHVAEAARTLPGVATGVLADTPLYLPGDYVRLGVGADAFHPSAESLGALSDAYRRAPSAAHLRRADLEALRGRGIPVLVYTVNAPEPGGLAAHLAEAGVSALFTDDPRSLRGLFDAG